MPGHKKGEDVVNNFAKTLRNAADSFESAIGAQDAGFAMSKLDRTQTLLKGFYDDPRLRRARDLLRAPASGEMNDLNSQSYGSAASAFQSEMDTMGRYYKLAIQLQATATKRADKEACANPYLNRAANAKNKAAKAWRKMVKQGYDEDAARVLLEEDINKQAIRERRDAVDAVRAAMKFFGVRGKDILNSWRDEMDAYVVQLRG